MEGDRPKPETNRIRPLSVSMKRERFSLSPSTSLAKLAGKPY
ncbi:hypothetical protein [Paenibacillus nanensis]|nr:hypothetical protein [Paenibacillus nanensis]